MVASMSMPSSSSSFRRSPAIIFFLGIFLLVAMVFRSNTKLADHDHHYRHDNVVRVTTGLVRQAQHEYAKLSASSSVFKYPSIKFSSPSPSSSANNASLSSLKELVKEAMDRGLVVIVNASEGDAARLFADNAHGARREWDINGALDGPTGEILAEVIQELRNMEELQQELAELKAKIKRSNVNDEGKVVLTTSVSCCRNVLMFRLDLAVEGCPELQTSQGIVQTRPKRQNLSVRAWFGRGLPSRTVVLVLAFNAAIRLPKFCVTMCSSGSCILLFRGHCPVPMSSKIHQGIVPDKAHNTISYWKKMGSKKIASSQGF